ncbi:hypothetical protein [Azohydromonas aeria]|uniref:hypothetical protein n=1 Tax=Azohydromonas aeria TaxID=2590212 RepID=UPI0012F8AE68|nr:hypothetical protein [Azohydromonas aeria]
MHLPHSARRTEGPARLLDTLATLLRRLALGVAALFLMAFTLLAGLVAAGVLLVVALVARRRLRRGDLRFHWARRGAGYPGTSAPWGGGRAGHGRGEVVDAEVREIRD